MATNFFQEQALARRRSSELVLLYCLSVIAIILAVYAAVYAIWFWGMRPPQIFESIPSSDNQALLPQSFFEPYLFIRVALITGGLILLGTLYKMAMLQSGGKGVAERLGGRLLSPETEDLHEKKALNVVEEMAIASGLPVPPVYLLSSEDAINAFAAGYSPSDAVIGLTRGCISKLKRDELQGVLGHEFSHILNGDMRLNIRLIGVLYGILLLGLIGEGLVRTAGGASDRKGGAAALALTGFALLVIGYVGVFFGKLIKAAVSRQREYLADAASVQFTRNPSGLSGALKKIAGLPNGSALDAHKAAEASHLFFANALASSFLNLFSTHPPILERIRRIDPDFRGTPAMLAAYAEEAGREADEELSALSTASFTEFAPIKQSASPGEIVNSIGKLSPERVAAAATLIRSFDTVISSAARNELGAKALILALVAESNAGRPQPEREEFYSKLGMDLAGAVEKLLPYARAIEPPRRLSLVDICIPSLKRLSQNEYFEFKRQLLWLIHIDDTVSFFEFAVSTIVCRHLDALFVGKAQRPIRLRNLNDAMPACADVLSHLAVVAATNSELRKKAFIRGLSCISAEAQAAFPDPKSLSLKRLDEALKILESASFEIRAKLMEAAACCVAEDGQVNANEMALIRAIGSRLDCPVPLPGYPQEVP